MGRNAELLDVAIDGEAAKLTVSARVTITPGRHNNPVEVPNPSSKSHRQQPTTLGPSPALCFVDVGRWLTRLGRFAE